MSGLFKLGITECFAARHYQHVHSWGEFDLRRSALLRTGNPREVRYLERILLYLFGDPGLLADQTPGPDGCSYAPASWRRDPGQRAGGHSEWFATGCLGEMLAFVASWLERRGPRAADARLSLGIDPTECTRRLETDSAALLARQRLSASRVEYYARRHQERVEYGGHITRELPWVLHIATYYAIHLLWVDLSHWQTLRALGASAHRKDKGLVDLYFGRFAPGSDDNYEPGRVRQLPATRITFERSVERVQSSAVRSHTSRLSKYRLEPMFHLRAPQVYPGDPPPHPACADAALLLRVECGQFIPERSLLAEFEALARQIESRCRLEQPVFDWQL